MQTDDQDYKLELMSQVITDKTVVCLSVSGERRVFPGFFSGQPSSEHWTRNGTLVRFA